MTAPNLHRAPVPVHHPTGHSFVWWLGVTMLAILVVAIVVVGWPAQSPAITSSARPVTVDLDAAPVCSVCGAFTTAVAKPAAVDPAASAVLSYIRVHEMVGQPAAVVAAPLASWCYESGENYQLCTQGR